MLLDPRPAWNDSLRTTVRPQSQRTIGRSQLTSSWDGRSSANRLALTATVRRSLIVNRLKSPGTRLVVAGLLACASTLALQASESWQLLDPVPSAREAEALSAHDRYDLQMLRLTVTDGASL